MKSEPQLDATEESVLKWPDGVERTRIKERVGHKAWRKSWPETKKALTAELERIGATSALITRHEDQRLDPGVSVWFSRAKEDFSWQQGLGLDNPAPTLAEIDQAFRDKVMKSHPDRGGDPALYKQHCDWRTAAKAWVTGVHAHAHEFVMAIDQYDEARLNLKALQMSFFYIRRLEDVGAPAILAQTLGAFRAKLTGGSSV
jgi:hypothetical protein